MGHSVLCNLFTKQKDFTRFHKTERKEKKETCKETLFIVQKRLSSCHSSFSFTKTIASFKACKHNAAKAKDQLGHKVSKRESVTIVKWVIVLNDGQSSEGMKEESVALLTANALFFRKVNEKKLKNMVVKEF